MFMDEQLSNAKWQRGVQCCGLKVKVYEGKFWLMIPTHKKCKMHLVNHMPRRGIIKECKKWGGEEMKFGRNE